MLRSLLYFALFAGSTTGCVSLKEQAAITEMILLARQSGRHLAQTGATRALKMDSRALYAWHSERGLSPPKNMRFDRGPIQFTNLRSLATGNTYDWVAGLTKAGSIYVAAEHGEDDKGGPGGVPGGGETGGGTGGDTGDGGTGGGNGDGGTGGGTGGDDGGGGSGGDGGGGGGGKCVWYDCSVLTGGCCQKYEGDASAFPEGCPTGKCEDGSDDDACCEGDPTCCGGSDGGDGGAGTGGGISITDLLYE